MDSERQQGGPHIVLNPTYESSGWIGGSWLGNVSPQDFLTTCAKGRRQSYAAGCRDRGDAVER